MKSCVDTVSGWCEEEEEEHGNARASQHPGTLALFFGSRASLSPVSLGANVGTPNRGFRQVFAHWLAVFTQQVFAQ
eukprot:5324040-Prymnesium_polylepis.1